MYRIAVCPNCHTVVYSEVEYATEPFDCPFCGELVDFDVPSMSALLLDDVVEKVRVLQDELGIVKTGTSLHGRKRRLYEILQELSKENTHISLDKLRQATSEAELKWDWVRRQEGILENFGIDPRDLEVDAV